MTTREIQTHLEELYGTDISPTLISTITDAVLEDVRLWQSRPLETVYPILYFDCLFVKSRHEGAVKTKAVYVALGVTLVGEKELLGLWVSETEGAKIWLAIFTELQQRECPGLFCRLCGRARRPPRSLGDHLSLDASPTLHRP